MNILFVFCSQGGKLLNQDEAVKNMKKGSNAVYGIFLEKEVLVDISLRGFTKAYNNLKPIQGN